MRSRPVATSVLIGLMALAGSFLPAVLRPQSTYMVGDVNCDGCVNCLDAELVSAYVHAMPGLIVLCCEAAADADADGAITAADAAAVAALPEGPGVCAPVNPAGLRCDGYRDELCTSPRAGCSAPVAAIRGPRRIVRLSSGPEPVTAWFDGRASLGTGGSAAEGFHWAVEPLGLPAYLPLDAAAPAAAVPFAVAGAHVVKLDVGPVVHDPFLGAGDTSCAYAEYTVVISDPTPGEAIAFVPLFGFQRAVLAGRRLRLPLLLESAPPDVSFALETSPAPPPGLSVDSKTGVIDWQPGLADVGTHTIGVAALALGLAPVVSVIDLVVIDPGRTGAVYAPPEAGGGGAVNTTAPLTLEDLSAVPIQVDLELSIQGPGCAASSVAGERAVRFAPECAAAAGDGSRGKVYSSPSSVPKLNDDAGNDFTVELWLANVPGAQQVPAGEAAFLFSASGAGAQLNWMVGTRGNGEYVAQIQTAAGVKTFSVTGLNFTGLRGDGHPHQLVFVRQGAEHRFFADGVEASLMVDPAPLQWTDGLRGHIGNNQGRTRPFSGDLYLAAFYLEALGAPLIEFLSELGPFADETDVPAPIAEVCPDPREIGRIDGDGTPSRAGWLGGGGGGGSLDHCDALRPFSWTVRALPAGPVLGFAAATGEEDCSRVIEVSFDESEVTGLELELTVHQVPVRDFEKSHTTIRRVYAFKRGNANNAGEVDLSDAVWCLNSLFLGAAAPPCMDAADSNDDGNFDLSDPVHILNYLFQGSAAPPAPGPFECGFDYTPDSSGQLGCVAPGGGCG